MSPLFRKKDENTSSKLRGWRSEKPRVQTTTNFLSCTDSSRPSPDHAIMVSALSEGPDEDDEEDHLPRPDPKLTESAPLSQSNKDDSGSLTASTGTFKLTSQGLKPPASPAASESSTVASPQAPPKSTLKSGADFGSTMACPGFGPGLSGDEIRKALAFRRQKTVALEKSWAGVGAEKD